MKKLIILLSILVIVSVASAEVWNYVYDIPQPATENETRSVFSTIYIDLGAERFIIEREKHSATGIITTSYEKVSNTGWSNVADFTVTCGGAGDITLINCLRNRLAQEISLPAGSLQ